MGARAALGRLLARRGRIDVRSTVADAVAAAPRIPRGTRPADHIPLTVPTVRIARPGGIWSAVEDGLDPSGWRPRLAPGVEIVDFPSRRGRAHAIVASPDRLAHYRVEPWEADLARRMDGTRSVQDLIVERLESDGDLDPSAVTRLVTLLRSEDLLDTRAVNVRKLVRRALDPTPTPRARVSEFGRTLRVDWPGVERMTRFLHRAVLRFAFRPVAIVACGIIAAAGFAAFTFLTETGRYDLGNPSYEEIGALLLLAFLLTAAHELGHATALIHYDRRVIASGVELLYATPAFFVDASDAQTLPKRERIVQAFAGPWAELILAGSASLFVLAFPDAPASTTLYRFALSNYFFIFQNFLPLLRLDGYWMLSDAIGEADLRGSAFQFLRHEFWHRLRRRERIRPQEWLLVLFATLGPLYALYASYLAILAWDLGQVVGDLWDGTIWSRLLLALLVVVFAGPVLRAAYEFAWALLRRARALLARVRFRFERSWRREATDLLLALPGFDDLTEAALDDLAHRMRLGTYAPGAPVFRQGDRPEAFYVVRSGEIAIEDLDPRTGEVRVLRTLGRGSSFGELGLLDMAARSATARATEETQLFEVGKSAFDRLLAAEIEAPHFAPSMQNFAELRALPTFRHLPVDRLAEVLDHGEWRTFATGDVVVQQGEPGDAFYAIARGQAVVDVDGEFVRTLGQGDAFGEIALLNDSPRTATVTASSAMRVFRLDREGFDAVVAGQFERGMPAHYRRSLGEGER